MSAENNDLCIASIRAEHYRKLAIVDLKPFGRHLRVSGKNAVGKSTILNLPYVALSGKAGADPIQKGQEDAFVEVNLANKHTGNIAFKIRRVWNDRGMSLDLRTGEGKKVKAPQEVLNKIFLPLCGHPQHWMRQRAVDQLDDMLRIFEVPVPVKEVTAIVGEHFPSKPEESAARYLDRLAADGSGVIYVRRTEKGRELLQKQKARDEFKPFLDDPEEGEEGDITELLAERKQLEGQRDEIRKARDEANATKAEHVAMARQRTQREEELAASNSRITSLEQELAKERLKAEDLGKRVMNCQRRADELLKLSKNMAAAVDALTDPSPRIATIDAALAEVDANRQAIAERKQAQETARRLQEEAEICEKQHAALDITLEAIRDLKRNMLNGLDLDVPGLEVGDGELLLNGVSFDQASNAQQIDVACALLMKQTPTVKLILLDNAESLDRDTEKVLLARARKHGWQMFLSYVDREEAELRTEIVDETEVSP